MPKNAATGRQYSGINGAPYRREKKEVSNERSGSLVMTCIHRTNLGQKWLRPRKRRGTTACPEKAQSVEAICGAGGQDKTCMAKAILPEPQFAATYTRSGAVECAVMPSASGNSMALSGQKGSSIRTRQYSRGGSLRDRRSHASARARLPWPVAGAHSRALRQRLARHAGCRR